MKPSKGDEVIRLMKEGWKLEYHRGFRSPGYYTLSTSPGNAWERVNGNTVNSLIRQKLIKQLPYKYGTFRVEYVLTEEGKK